MQDPLNRHLQYCASHIGKSLLWVAADFITIYALVKIGTVEPWTAGALFVAGMMANALADAAIGQWVDRHPHHEARLAAGGLVIAAITFPFTILTMSWGPSVLLPATLMFRIAYAAFDVPHNALLSKIAPTPAITMRLSRLRTLGTGIAAGLIGAGLHFVSGRDSLIVLLVLIGIAAVSLGWTLLPLLRHDRSGLTRSPQLDDKGSMTSPIAFFVATISGIVGLGILVKAAFHLPADGGRGDAGELLILLTTGRTLAALLPLRLDDGRFGMAMLAGTYGLVGIAILPVMAEPGGGGLFLLGLAMGATNMVAWTTLPFVVCNASGYGLYTMSIKIALGVAGLLMTAWLGAASIFTVGDFLSLAVISFMACEVAALLLVWPLMKMRRRGFATSGNDAR